MNNTIAVLRERKRLADGPCRPAVLEHHDTIAQALKGLGVVEIQFPAGITEMCRKSDLVKMLDRLKPKIAP